MGDISKTNIKGWEHADYIVELWEKDKLSMKKIADKIARLMPDQLMSDTQIKKILLKKGKKMRPNRQKPKNHLWLQKK